MHKYSFKARGPRKTKSTAQSEVSPIVPSQLGSPTHFSARTQLLVFESLALAGKRLENAGAEPSAGKAASAQPSAFEAT